MALLQIVLSVCEVCAALSAYSTSQTICRTLDECLSGLCNTPAHGMFWTVSKTLVCLLQLLGNGGVIGSKAPAIVCVTTGDALPLPDHLW